VITLPSSLSKKFYHNKVNLYSLLLIVHGFPCISKSLILGVSFNVSVILENNLNLKNWIKKINIILEFNWILILILRDVSWHPDDW
jgi:uncharacterized protein (DUF2344 family)